MRLEYVWLDGYSPANLRSKTKIIEHSEHSISLDDVPDWSFDGSSTKQAEGRNSDCILKPIRKYRNPIDGGYIILCEVYTANGKPHLSNTRADLIVSVEEEKEYWWGFEQEYFLINLTTKRALGWPEPNDENYVAPAGMSRSVYRSPPQGKYYCGVGSDSVQGRDIVELHLELCVDAGIKITGTNAEVALGQWEYQCFNTEASQACDDLWVSRYLLYRAAEVYNIGVELHPKPYGDCNGSGCHINFSNAQMRNEGSKEIMTDICKKLGDKHELHMEAYGEYNDMRLTGLHETQNISIFSYGESDRGASIRIPIATIDNEYKGYLEDRRPSSNVDPYQATFMIMETVK